MNSIIISSVIFYIIIVIIAYIVYTSKHYVGGDLSGNAMAKGLLFIYRLGGLFFNKRYFYNHNGFLL